MICILEKNDLLIATKIYFQAFNTDENSAKNIICDFADRVYAYKEENDTLGIICATKLPADNKEISFLFGGAVISPQKNKGIFKALLSHAINACDEKSCIVACSNDYEDFYESRGFQKSAQMRMFNREIKRNLWARADFDTVTAKKLCENRAKFIKSSYLKLTHKQAAVLLSAIYSKGASSAETQKAYAIYYRLPDKLLITELYAESDVDAWYLLEAIADRDGRNNAEILLSSENTVFAGEGRRYFSCMILSKEDLEINYLGELPS